MAPGPGPSRRSPFVETGALAGQGGAALGLGSAAGRGGRGSGAGMASGPRRGKEFQGRLEMVVGLTEDGRGAMITLPGPGESESPAAAPFRLTFKHFQRVDGIFRVSPRARVSSVQLRVYEAGSAEPKVTRNVTLG